MTWQKHALEILEEAVKAYHAECFRAAVHGAYDAVLYACETGFPDTYLAPESPKGGKPTYQDRVLAVAGARRIPGPLREGIMDNGPLRNNMAHGDYLHPSKDAAKRALVSAIFFLDALDVRLSTPPVDLIPPVEPEEPSTKNWPRVTLRHPLLDAVTLHPYHSEYLGWRMFGPTDWYVRDETRGINFYNYHGALSMILSIYWVSDMAAADIDARLSEGFRDQGCEDVSDVNSDTWGRRDWKRVTYQKADGSERRFGFVAATQLRSDHLMVVQFDTTSPALFGAVARAMCATVAARLELTNELPEYDHEAVVKVIASRDFRYPDAAHPEWETESSADGVQVTLPEVPPAFPSIVVRDRGDGTVTAIGEVLRPATLTPRKIRNEDYATLLGLGRVLAASRFYRFYVPSSYANEAMSMMKRTSRPCPMYAFDFRNGRLSITELRSQ